MWSILINGKEYSRFYTNLRSQKHEKTIIAQWKERFTSRLPEGIITAKPYISTALDHYGR